MPIKLKIDFNFMGQQFPAGTVRSFGADMDKKLLAGDSAEIYEERPMVGDEAEKEPDTATDLKDEKESSKVVQPPIGRKNK